MAKGEARTRQAVELPVHVDVGGSAAAAIGERAGLLPSEIDALEPRLREAITRLEDERAEGRRPFLELAEQRGDLDAVLAQVQRFRGEVDWCVVVGGDGSAAGNRLLADALIDCPGEPGDGRVGLLILDSAEPRAVQSVLDRVDLGRTVVHVISRASESLETLAAFLVLRDHLVRELGAVEYVDHLLVTTDADAGPLRQLIHDEGLHGLDFPAGVSGHQAATSPIHLFGAALAGVDVEAFLSGVRAMDAQCRTPEVSQNPAAMLAANHYLLATLHGMQIEILQHYSDRLGGFAQWWRQFWAPTLGKRHEGEFSSMSMGTTPVVARGTVDNHTQLQLYLDGPTDKLVTFLRVVDEGPQLEIPRSLADFDDIAFLGGRGLGEMVSLQQKAVEWAMMRAGRPSVSIELADLAPETLGRMVRLFEVTGLLCASLHDVDPQARPAVEATRRMTLAALGRPGFEDEAQALRRWLEERGEEIPS